ncbi:MAG TPA: hypothetical protein DD640_06360 [Clostridiales bacterium]|nr:hypothetical protein [Clostridiales bacterium]
MAIRYDPAICLTPTDSAAKPDQFPLPSAGHYIPAYAGVSFALSFIYIKPLYIMNRIDAFVKTIYLYYC